MENSPIENPSLGNPPEGNSTSDHSSKATSVPEDSFAEASSSGNFSVESDSSAEKKSFRKRNSTMESAELNMTPMIDIVFLLMSFFTLVINFSQTEQHEQVTLPMSELAQPPEGTLSEPMTLQVASTGEIFLGTIGCFLDDQKTAGNGKPFSQALKDELRIFSVFNNTKPSDVTVIIRADENTRAGFIQRLIQSCQAQGLETFNLRARQGNYE